MARFTYRARALSGQVVEGILDAESDRAVCAQLAARALFPVAIRAEARGEAKGEGPGSPRRADVAQFLSELAELVEAGVPLLDAVRSISSHAPRREMKAMLESFDTALSEGASLSAAMGSYPKVFSRVEVALVTAAEKGGFLAQALDRLAGQREYLAETRSTVITALAYPSVLVVVLVAVVALLMTLVVPKFEALFADMGARLPLPTLILIGASRLAASFWYVAVLAAAALVAAAVTLSGRRKWRSRAQQAALATPLVSDVLTRFAASRFSRSLALMLHGGVPMTDALGLAGMTTGIHSFTDEVDAALVSVRDGAPLAASLKRSGFLSPSQIEMLAVAEKAGDLPGALSRIADKSDKAAAVAIKRALAVIEPALIVVMAAIVGYVVLSLLVPIFTISAAVR